MSDSTQQTGANGVPPLAGPTGSAIAELEEALNDLSTIRTGPTATFGYIEDMGYAKAHIVEALRLLSSPNAETVRPAVAGTHQPLVGHFESEVE